MVLVNVNQRRKGEEQEETVRKEEKKTPNQNKKIRNEFKRNEGSIER